MAEAPNDTILIVEDDPGVARLQARRLERAGYAVATVGTAADALRRVEEGGVALVLLDYRLPDQENGLDFLARLQAAGHDLPVILVTGFSDEATAIRALRAGVRDFVTKSAAYLDYLPEAAGRVLRQVRTEAELAESRARLAAVVRSAMDAVLTLDGEGRVTLFNPAAEQIFGCAAAQALGQPVGRFIAGDLPAAGQTDGRVETLGRRGDGTEFPLEVSCSRAEAGGPGQWTLFARDITERRRADERIREQAALLDAATDAIYVRDLDGRILYWNRSAERLYGWPAAEALGQPAADLLYQEPGDMDAPRRALHERGEWAGELRQHTRAGKEIIVASRWTLVRDPAGHPAAELVINTDVTDQRRLESQYLRAQRMESIGRLAGGIAHDLNNVLAQFLMALECLKGELAHEDRLAVLGDMQTSARRGADIVKQVLSFASGAEGQRAPFQPRHIVRDVERMLRHTLPRSVEVQVQLPADLWAVVGDATQLYQVVMNLCINALDAMPHGGRLTVAAQNALLDASYAAMHIEARPGPYVLVRVADTGTGIPPDVLDKIFDPFFTTKGPGKGTGLGLSTVLGIVKAHGGFINVYSEVGKGTEFAAYLPAAEDAQTRQAAEQRKELPAGRGELVLVVDDEAAIRQITKATLEAYGYRVLTATDGAEAVALFAEHRGEVRAVLTDMVMPVMDGAATIRALRKLDPQVRVLAASGLAASGQAADAAALGARAFLQKPFTADVLLTALREVLDAKPASG